MNKNLQHLTLYLSAISFVVILFTLVTSYGEANLKTVSKIAGTYSIDSSIPNCQNIQLAIQQSGTYINAAIAPLGAKSEGAELSGKWQGQNLLLSGNSKICNVIAIAATIKTKDEVKTKDEAKTNDKAQQIIGKITTSNHVLDFTATLIETTEEKSQFH
jgi:hypothetical protein